MLILHKDLIQEFILLIKPPAKQSALTPKTIGTPHVHMHDKHSHYIILVAKFWMIEWLIVALRQVRCISDTVKPIYIYPCLYVCFMLSTL